MTSKKENDLLLGEEDPEGSDDENEEEDSDMDDSSVEPDIEEEDLEIDGDAEGDAEEQEQEEDMDEGEEEGIGEDGEGVGTNTGNIRMPRKKNDKPKDEFLEQNYESEDDSEADEEIDHHHLQKFNENLNISFLEKMHPEIQSIDYQEMIALARVVRDKNGKIIDPLHKTMPFLTKYERARIIGARAEQVDHGGEPFIPVEESVINGRTIALLEFEAKKIPFIISRPLPNGSKEYWHLHDLEILD
jgi:DNA-directed RNA polymerase I, II, and III subunit RPABC2